MNKNTHLYESIKARGGHKALPAGFIAGTMERIAVAERRRRRIALFWYVSGCVLAAFVVAAALVYYCGRMFLALFHEMVGAMTMDAASWHFMAMLVLASGFLLGADAVLRRYLGKC